MQEKGYTRSLSYFPGGTAYSPDCPAGSAVVGVPKDSPL